MNKWKVDRPLLELLWIHIAAAAIFMLIAWNWQNPIQIIAGLFGTGIAALGLYRGYKVITK